MEIEVSSSTHDSSNPVVELDSIRVKRKTLQNLLEDCQRALELLNLTETGPTRGSQEEDNNSDSPEMEEEEFSSSSDQGDPETDKLYYLIKSRVEGHGFREKIELAQVSFLQDLPDGSSWDVVSEDDYVWGEGQTEDDYVLVREEDIADGIVCFMATYLSSLNQTKDISPDQLQKEHRQAKKKLDLWKLPEILVVNKDGQSCLYELYAVSNHYGGLGGGHYTACAKLMDENKWYDFDDSRVSPIDESEIKTLAAYVLFYRRVKSESTSSYMDED